ncbi:MAG: 50S ribosomal protein L13 [Deltaproteobacteria bacterium]|nr:50S ribosomal protein L13 [Deltaproteobacteria bacterium]
MKTISAKPSEVTRKWVVVDLQGKTLGRAASAIACILRGKHKPEFTPHVDTGDFVVVVNADKVQLTGRKWDLKIYYHHSQYPGGLRSWTAKQLLAHKPGELVRLAVKGMLPKNPLGRAMIKKLKVYAAPGHPHEAQQPTPVEI